MTTDDSEMTPNREGVGRCVAKLFSQEALKDLASVALANARTEIESSDKALKANIFMMLAAAVLFELLDRAKVTELSVLGVKIDGTGFLIAIAPILFAAFYYQAMSATASHEVYDGLYRSLLQARYPDVERADLVEILVPSGKSPLTGVEVLRKYSDARKSSGWYKLFLLVLTTITVYAPIPYVVALYIRLFRARGLNDVGIWLSGLVSILLVTLGWLAVFTGMNVRAEPDRIANVDMMHRFEDERTRQANPES